MNTEKNIALIEKLRIYRSHSTSIDYSKNKFLLDFRSQKYFMHKGQKLPKVHSTVNKLLDVMVSMILVEGSKRVLEIGTLYGYSTLHFAYALSQTGGTVDTVDLRVPKRKWHDGQIVENIHESALHFAEESQLRDIINFHSGSSTEILPDMVFNDGPQYDLIFIDGSHSRYVVTLDLLNSINLLSKDGIIFFDDVSEGIAVKDFHHGGPNSILPSLIGKFGIVPFTGNTLALTK